MGTNLSYLVFLGAVAVALLTVSLNRALKLRDDGRIAAQCFWITAGFGGVGVMFLLWVGTGEPIVLIQRVVLGLIGAALGGFALVGVGELIRPSKPVEAPTAPSKPSASSTSAPASQRQPTLQASGGSKIDASGAKFDADLPFPFAKADGNSVIDMPGISVTKTENGFVVSPGNVTRAFPPPTGEFSNLTDSDVRKAAHEFVLELLHFQTAYDAEFYDSDRKWPSREKAEAVSAKYIAIFDEKYKAKALSIASEVMTRVGTIRGADLSPIGQHGGVVIYHGKLAGPSPAAAAAEFLEVISQRLVTADSSPN